MSSSIEQYGASSDDHVLFLIGYTALIREYVLFLEAKLAFHRAHREFNGLYPFSSFVWTLPLLRGYFVRPF